VRGEQSRLLDTCRVRYRIHNRDSKEHTVGIPSCWTPTSAATTAFPSPSLATGNSATPSRTCRPRAAIRRSPTSSRLWRSRTSPTPARSPTFG
jgi:hypothetical protein